MTYYRIFEGGNYNTLSPAGNIMTAARDGIEHGEYAGHIKTRHRVPQFHFDRASTGIQQWFNEIGDLEVGVDEVALSWLLDGSMVNSVVFHNKAVADATLEVNFYGGSSLTAGAGVTEEDVIFTQVVDLSVVGYTDLTLPGKVLLQTNGEITIKLISGSLQGACFTLSPDVVHHNDGHRCECAPICCETLYPKSGCPTSVVLTPGL